MLALERSVGEIVVLYCGDDIHRLIMVDRGVRSVVLHISSTYRPAYEIVVLVRGEYSNEYVCRVSGFRVTVVLWRRTKRGVRMAFDAPDEVSIDRLEVYDRKQLEEVT